jgi:hypothetical protein
MAGDHVEHRPRVTDDLADEPARTPPVVGLVVVATLSVVAATVMAALSPHGVHTTSDSFTYLGAAENLARGNGWTYPFGAVGDPVTLFPPLYPTLLALPALMGIDPFVWVTWQNVVLLAVFCFVVGATIRNATGGSTVAAAIGVVLTLLGTPTIITYARIWSESIFLPLIVGVVATLDRFIASKRIVWLVCSAVLMSVAMLTRYTGLSLFATSCLLLVVWPGRRVLDRIRAVALYGAIALPPSVAWMIRNQARSGTLTGNNELIHSLSFEDVMDGVRTIGSWLARDPIDDPTQWPFVLAIAGVVPLIALLAATILRRSEPAWRLLPSLVPACLTFVVVHFSFIAIADAFSTRAPPFNDRILGPAFAPLMIAIVVLGHAVWVRSANHVAPRILLGVGTISLMASSLVAAGHLVPGNWGTETGSKTAYDDLSRPMQDVIAPDARLLSNRPNVAWFVADRPVSGLPRSCRGGRTLPSLTYARDLRLLARRLGDEPRQVLIFRRSRECSPFSLEAVMRTLRLVRRARFMRVVVLEGPIRPP